VATQEPLRVHLEIGSRFENIEAVQIVLEDLLARLGLEEDARHRTDIAVREAVANAIEHGHGRDPSQRVTVDLAVEGGELVIQVHDQGEGFDPGEIQDRPDPDTLLEPHGRGIVLMKRFMDEIHYGRRPGGGTIVTLRKRVPAAKADPRRGEAPEIEE
jgi:serine/threonine-protein kinase RsbW